MKKTAFITGVNGGIGSATAKLFMESGWEVFGTDLANKPSVSSLADYFSFDLSKTDRFGKMKDFVDKNFPNGLHALVNNAAQQLNALIAETKPDDLSMIMNVNLSAPILLTQACLKPLEKAKGSIVNISSVHAVATSSNISAYAASKGGLVSFTKAAAIELAEKGIRVNAVLPGGTRTEMLIEGLKRGHSVGLEAFSRKHPIGRIGEPLEIAQAILFLADSKTSSFMTGQTMIIDGGVTARLSTE